MVHDESNTLQKKREQIELKIAYTQKMIRNKFKKACLNRCKQERDAKHAMHALATTKTNVSKSFVHDFSKPKATAANISSNRSNKSIKIETNDPNILCTRLRVLLASTNASDVEQTIEKNAIIRKLHGLHLLV